jgi:hypothetical protein
VDGKSDWLISIMKDFDWLQVHINNSFKNSSVKAQMRYISPLWHRVSGQGLKATINIKVKTNPLSISSNFFSFMLYGRK